MAVILIEHPSRLAISELSRALSGDPDEFAGKDAVDRAVQELVGAGLLRREGEVVAPTRAALYFQRLEAS